MDSREDFNIGRNLSKWTDLGEGVEDTEWRVINHVTNSRKGSRQQDLEHRWSD